MQTIDYSNLFDTQDPLPGAEAAEVMYRRSDGIQLRSRQQDREFRHEAIRLSGGAILLATQCAPLADELHQQVVSESDWVHIQFRFRGAGSENISSKYLLETPERSCILARYPKNSTIEREIPKADHWKYVCLYLTPGALTDLLGVAAKDLPQSALWMGLGAADGFHSDVLPLQSAMMPAVNDILTCAFRGANRHAYMRAKALELLTTVIHALDVPLSNARSVGTALSVSDRDKISRVHSLISEDFEGHQTLAELARGVGLNRTKLALGFKEVYGVSVQAYWRDARLLRARDLLRNRESNVTDVAFGLGYSELSSFTRAFSRKFGVLPRDWRKKT